ncbi:MAG: hypothetical protein HZB81_04785 [Deltaproteobacteria bacterium]|nr:hypothetical protein [Deltaproteobacteria bacterium]
MKREKITLLSLIFIFLISLLSHPDPAIANSLSCLICHGTSEGVIFIDGERFSKSVHGTLDCTSCHLKYIDTPHKTLEKEIDKSILDISLSIRIKSKADPVALSACNQCHPDVFGKVKGSVHGQNIFKKKKSDGAYCTDCHGSAHYISPGKSGQSPVDFGHVMETCGGCHEKESISKDYGFSPKVLERYKESFHGKKYILGHKKVPVCTTCHGSHDVKSSKDPQAMVFGTNRLNLCSSCHPGANNKFTSAITHKPVGRDNPIPYYAEKTLIVLTISVIAGCILHVLLEAYAIIRDYLREKRREE